MQNGRERLFSAVAWAYLVLLPCHLRLSGPVFVHDLLAPVFLAAVILRGDGRRWLRVPDVGLTAFGGWCLLATLTRPTGGRDLYELAIFAYMALLYAFFSRTRLAPRSLALYALAVGIAFWLVGIVQAAGGLVQTHSAYVGTTLGFLARRYGFTFGNPNLLGSFTVLPVACALLAATAGRAGQGTGAAPPRRPGAGLAVRAVLLGLPLLLTASRHMILSGALVLSWLPGLLPPPRQRVGRVVSWLALGLAFAAFYLTVLFPFFPLRLGFPFINCRTPGMYMVHQKAYLEMALLDRQAALFGLGRTAVVERYPDLVDRGLAVTVLAEYHMDELLPSFIAYMDAHCEYLNLATAFGLPALAALAAFLAMLARRAGASSLEPGRLLLFFVAGLCMACLWDDLLSKRWIWLTLGLLAAASETAAACPAGAVSPVPTPGARAEPATP